MKYHSNILKLLILCSICPVYGQSEEMKIKVSAYCLCSICCDDWSKLGVDRPLTHSKLGRKASDKNGVAVDPKLIPYGSKLTLPDGTVLIADDLGGAIKGKRIDIRIPGDTKADHWKAFTHKYSQKTITIKIERPDEN